jgi:hypothetical protein
MIHAIAWIPNAGLYYIFSPASSSPWSGTAHSHKFCLDVMRGVVECWGWTLPSSSIVSPQCPPSGTSLKVLSMGMSWCSCKYTRVPSAAWLTKCI